ncbi:MAG: 50S ribosomal protein L4 [Bdellovibrionales bacterium]|nr:50S ribosomal protein L4 [Bdellovibrionales bacterium]
MPSLELFNQKKEKVGNINLSDAVFATEINRGLVHQVVKAQLADRRQGTAKTKVKSEVRGGGAKPFKQKGTGNARQGSTRSPLMVGGGQNFGPQPRSYAERTPKEMVKGALRSALSDRVKAARVIVLDKLTFAKPKTADAEKVIKDTFKLDKVLVIATADQNVELSMRNLKGVRMLRTEGLNVYDILKHDWLMMTQDAVKAIETRLGVEK